MRKYIFLFLFILVLSSLYAQDLKIVRFDKQFFEYLKNGNKGSLLNSVDTSFIKALSQTLNIPDTSTSQEIIDLKNYYTHPVLFKMYSETEQKYSDMSSYEKSLNEALTLANSKMLISDKTVFCTHVSGLKENIISVNNTISISLDKYLGSDYELYRYFFSEPQVYNMSSDMIVKDYVKAWLLYNYVNKSTESTLLSDIIFEGKTAYIMSQILPDYTIAQLLGKKDADLDLCKSVTKKNWKKIQANDLYSEDHSIIHHWMEENNQIGVWIGYEIVSTFMKNSNTSIDQLLKLGDGEILKISKYTP